MRYLQPHPVVLPKTALPHRLRYLNKNSLKLNPWCYMIFQTKFCGWFHWGVFFGRSVSQTLISLILWHRRKPASPTSVIEGQPHPPRIALRTRAALALNAHPYPPMSPQALPLISPSHPTHLPPLTSSLAQLLTPTHQAPQRAVAPRTCPWTRVPPAEILHPSPFRPIDPCKIAISILTPVPDHPPALRLAPYSQLPPLSFLALPCPASPVRRLKRSLRSTKTRIEKGRKGSERKEMAVVLMVLWSRL